MAEGQEEKGEEDGKLKKEELKGKGKNGLIEKGESKRAQENGSQK